MSIKLNKSLKRPSIFQAHSTSLIQPSRSSFIPDVTCQSQCSSRFKHAATTIVTSTVKRFKLRRGKKGVSSLEVIVPATVVAADLPLSYLSRRRRGRRPSTAVDIPLSHTLSISGPRRSQRIHPLRSTPAQSEPTSNSARRPTLSSCDASRPKQVVTDAQGDDIHTSVLGPSQIPADDLVSGSTPLPSRSPNSYIFASQVRPPSPTISEWRESILRLVTQPLRHEGVLKTTQTTLLAESLTPHTPTSLLPSNIFVVGSSPPSNGSTPGDDDLDSSFEQYFRNFLQDEDCHTSPSTFGGHFLKNSPRAYSPSIVHSARVRSEQGHGIFGEEIDSTESVYDTTGSEDFGLALSNLLLPLPLLDDYPSRTSSGARVRTMPLEDRSDCGVGAERNTFGQPYAESSRCSDRANNTFGVRTGKC